MHNENTFGYILRTRKKVLLWMILSFLFFFLTQVVFLLVPGILRKTIDLYIPQRNMEKIWLMIALIILIPLFSAVLNMVYNRSQRGRPGYRGGRKG